MRRALGPGLLLLLISSCIADNPAFCDPGGAACPMIGDASGGPGPGPGPGDGPDLGVLPTGPEDLRQEGPPPDLRQQEPPPDLQPACREGADCPSRICLDDGSCASPADVVYVDNRNGACVGSHTGTQADPVCGSKEALELFARSGKRRAYFAASNVPYGGLAVDGLQVSLYGPGSGGGTTARIEGQALSPAVSQKGGAVVLDGLELGGANAEVVLCQNGAGAMAQLSVLRCRVRDGLAHGVVGRGCQVTVRRSVVRGNGGRGVIAESGGELLVENSFIVDNRGGGVRMSSGRIRFSTLVYNGLPGGVGGVECASGGAQKLVENSLLIGNGRQALGSSLSSTCRLLRSAIDEDSFGNGAENRFRAMPDFAGFQDFRLRRGVGSSACCIDQLTAAAGVSDVLVDYDGTSRPQGARWDIGAHEVK